MATAVEYRRFAAEGIDLRKVSTALNAVSEEWRKIRAGELEKEIQEETEAVYAPCHDSIIDAEELAEMLNGEEYGGAYVYPGSAGSVNRQTIPLPCLDSSMDSGQWKAYWAAVEALPDWLEEQLEAAPIGARAFFVSRMEEQEEWTWVKINDLQWKEIDYWSSREEREFEEDKDDYIGERREEIEELMDLSVGVLLLFPGVRAKTAERCGLPLTKTFHQAFNIVLGARDPRAGHSLHCARPPRRAGLWG